MVRVHRTLVAVCVVGVSFVLGACRIAAPTAEDNVRRENAALQERVLQLEARTSELEAKLAARATSPDEADVAMATPAIAGIEIDRLSGFAREGASGAPGRLLLYVKPFDGRRRFTQAVGTMIAEARSSDGAVIASRTLSVPELRDAYRSQFSGTYYVVEIDVPTQEASKIASLRAELVDRLTGARHDASRELRSSP